MLRDLPQQIQALEQGILDQTAGRELHVGANAAVNAALASGARAADALEAIVLNAPPLDAETLAIWRNARRVGPTHLKEAPVVAAGPTAEPPAPPFTPGPGVASTSA